MTEELEQKMAIEYVNTNINKIYKDIRSEQKYFNDLQWMYICIYENKFGDITHYIGNQEDYTNMYNIGLIERDNKEDVLIQMIDRINY